MTGKSRRAKTLPPTAAEIERLLAFLPRLSAEGFTPIGHWGAMIEGGHVRRLLERLAELQAEER